jgi:hypothetical protein
MLRAVSKLLPRTFTQWTIFVQDTQIVTDSSVNPLAILSGTSLSLPLRAKAHDPNAWTRLVERRCRRHRPRGAQRSLAANRHL